MNLLKHSLWFVPLFVVSLALKFQNATVTVEEVGETLAQAAFALEKQGYEVRIENIGHGRLTVKRGRCSGHVRLMDSHATANVFYRSTLRIFPNIRYAWRGTWYDRRPWLGPLIEFYGAREVARHGIAAKRKPLWIVGLGPKCPDEFPATFSDVPLMIRADLHR
jgi:hypothetical protein